MDTATYTGHLLLLMAPMGSGKSVLVKYLKEKYPEVYFSVSCTTRAPRPGEEDGIDYHFITRETFMQRVDEGLFLEWAEFGGNLYGTLKSEIVERLQQGQIVLNEIELQGIEILKPIIPTSHRTIIYVEAGGWDVLRARALARAPISEEELTLRYERYEHEAKAKPLADVVINNFDGGLESAYKEIDALVSRVRTTTLKE